MNDGQVGIAVASFAAGAAVLLSLGCRQIARQAREVWGRNDLNWPEGIAIGLVFGGAASGVAGVIAAVGYVVALVHGALPLWSLAGPSLAALYAWHRLQQYMEAKRQQRDAGHE